MSNDTSRIVDFDPTQSETTRSDNTTGLFVSLYMIVLAFFVVMNSISNQDQNKVNAATESVTRAFSNPYEPEADFVDVSADKLALTPNDEFYEQILGVFASLVGFDGKFPAQGGDVVKVKFNLSDIFEDGAKSFRPDQQKFFQQLAGFLAGGRSSTKREIDILISSGKTLPKGPKYWNDLNILRAGAFVTYLKNMGVEENKLSIGIVKGEEDQLVLTFYNRERINSKQELTDHLKHNFPNATDQNPPQNNNIIAGDGL